MDATSSACLEYWRSSLGASGNWTRYESARSKATSSQARSRARLVAAVDGERDRSRAGRSLSSALRTCRSHSELAAAPATLDAIARVACITMAFRSSGFRPAHGSPAALNSTSICSNSRHDGHRGAEKLGDVAPSNIAHRRSCRVADDELSRRRCRLSRLRIAACRRSRRGAPGRARRAGRPSAPARPAHRRARRQPDRRAGLAPDEAYPALLQQRLNAAGLELRGRQRRRVGRHVGRRTVAARLGARRRRRVLIVALGGNDALRGLPLEQLQRNLAQIIETRAGAAASRDPRGHGSAAELRAATTSSRFHKVYPDARRRSTASPLVPFLLRGRRRHRAAQPGDGIHPTRGRRAHRRRQRLGRAEADAEGARMRAPGS